MSKRDKKKGKVLKDMEKRSSGLKIECKPSTILLLASALTLFMLIMLQVSHCVEIWAPAWIMSFILLLIWSLFFKSQLFKIVFGFIITLITITSIVGLFFIATSHTTSHSISTSLVSHWENNLIPALISYVAILAGTILWMSNY